MALATFRIVASCGDAWPGTARAIGRICCSTATRVRGRNKRSALRHLRRLPTNRPFSVGIGPKRRNKAIAPYGLRILTGFH
jgi:hypothetical protein